MDGMFADKLADEEEFKRKLNIAVNALELGQNPPSDGNYEALLGALWIVVSRMCKEEKEVGRG